MTVTEVRATAGLAGIFGLRMLGMFIILPVFALYAETLPGGRDHALVGLALGAYGLTQAMLQIPFGWLSDRFGRKPVIHAGLAIFALGSFVAASAPDIAWTIAGRTLQGAGAVSAAVIALTADLTRESVRTKAMAMIGMTIGATFALSLVSGPILKTLFGVPGIFALTGVLALAAMGVLRWSVPSTSLPLIPRGPSSWIAFVRVLANAQLVRLNYGIFALHAALMALFIQIPFDLRDAGMPVDEQWKVYLPVVLGSVVLMWPALRLADRPKYGKRVFVAAIAVLIVAEVMLAIGAGSLARIIAGLVVFFAAFNLLEATLPSLVSKFAPAALKGTAVGVYSSIQFMGTFVGAAAGGWIAQHVGHAAVFGLGVVLSALWLLLSATMASPPAYSSNYSLGET